MKIFHLPDLGEGLAEAEIREWYVKAGETVSVDQLLVSMETAKAVVDVPSPYAGKIAQLHGQANDMIATGSPLVTFAEAPEKEKPLVGQLEESTSQWTEENIIVDATKTKTTSIKALPVARALAKQLNVDLNLVTPSGQHGQIIAEDVKRYAAEHSPRASQEKKNSSPVLENAEGLHGVRRIMAQAMAQSHREVVPVTIIEDADVTDLPLADMTTALLQAMVAGCQAEPALNVWFNGDNLTRKVFQEVHIGLAVDTPEGLFVPVIRNVEKLSAEALREQINHYKKVVASRSVASQDMQKATMTLSNFGTITGRYANPIIVPPTVAILGCGRMRDTAIPRKGEVTIRRIAPLSLTFDHRAVTGGEATRFLATVIHYLEGKR